MKVIYVAGPYKASTERGVVENIYRAEDVGIKLWQAGFVALVPHMNTMLFGGICRDEIFLSGDLELMRRCDAVMLVKGWEKSKGTLEEIKEAKKLCIPVFKNLGKLLVWDVNRGGNEKRREGDG